MRTLTHIYYPGLWLKTDDPTRLHMLMTKQMLLSDSDSCRSIANAPQRILVHDCEAVYCGEVMH